MPIEKLGPGDWDPAPRFTLGEAWAGRCMAFPHALEESEQRSLCNRGYVRGSCAHFPALAPDAVRFAWNAAKQLIYILEKDHAPVEYGVVDLSQTEEPRASQACAFMTCWPG
jgi:hypothetical protein